MTLSWNKISNFYGRSEGAFSMVLDGKIGVKKGQCFLKCPLETLFYLGACFKALFAYSKPFGFFIIEKTGNIFDRYCPFFSHFGSFLIKSSDIMTLMTLKKLVVP